MWPTIYQLGPLRLSSYGLLVAVGFLVAVWLAAAVTKRQLGSSAPIPSPLVVDWGTWVIVGGVVGGRLLYVILNWSFYAQQLTEIVSLWHGGLVWYGGFFGGLAAHVFFCRRHRIHVLGSLDQVMPFVALGHAIGRIGCFANGCCYGVSTTAWFGVQFPGHPHPLVPVQLFESVSVLALYVVLRAVQAFMRLRQPGLVFGCYLIGYGLIRSILEHWRADQPTLYNGVTLHELISYGLIGIGIGLVTFSRRLR